MSQQYVEIELAGKTRLLRMDYNSVCDIEENFGKGIHQVISTEHIGLRTLRVLYWAGLKWKNPGLTIASVGQLLNQEITENGADLKALFEPVLKALKQTKLLGGAKEEDGDQGEEAESPNE